MNDDPVEKIVADTLRAACYEFVRGDDPRANGLDFYIPAFDLHIEVKQFHSDRIAEQTSRVENVIVIQGTRAAKALRHMMLAPRI